MDIHVVKPMSFLLGRGGRRKEHGSHRRSREIEIVTLIPFCRKRCEIYTCSGYYRMALELWCMTFDANVLVVITL